jgi:hypothetical protein
MTWIDKSKAFKAQSQTSTNVSNQTSTNVSNHTSTNVYRLSRRQQTSRIDKCEWIDKYNTRRQPESDNLKATATYSTQASLISLVIPSRPFSSIAFIIRSQISFSSSLITRNPSLLKHLTRPWSYRAIIGIRPSSLFERPGRITIIMGTPGSPGFSTSTRS